MTSTCMCMHVIAYPSSQVQTYQKPKSIDFCDSVSLCIQVWKGKDTQAALEPSFGAQFAAIQMREDLVKVTSHWLYSASSSPHAFSQVGWGGWARPGPFQVTDQ